MGNIQNHPGREMKEQDFENMNCSHLVDYIIQKHHRYAFNAISQIKLEIENTVRLDPDNPELRSIRNYFSLISNEFILHMQKEELVLFPNIHKLVLAESKGIPFDTSGFTLIKSPASVMMTEHKTINLMEENIVKLTNNFEAPANVSSSSKKLFQLLNEFDENLRQHSHLEDDILVPKLMALIQVFPN